MTSRRIFVALLGLLAALDVLILAIRVSDILTASWTRPLAAEGPVLYSIWKLRHGYPLYEWPTRPYFALTLYNFLFYDVYAVVFSALRVPNDAMSSVGRFVTLAFAAAGAAIQYAAGRRFAAPFDRLRAGARDAEGPGSFRLPLALLSFVTWFGCLMPGAWSMGIRPDVPGMAFATAGIAIALTAVETNRPGRLLMAGAAFFLAWTFKQSQLALFAATFAYVLVWRRSLKALALLAAPLVIGVAAAMAIGGGPYRANLIDAPAINPLIPYLALYWYRSVALTDLLLWGMAVYAIVALVRPGSVHGPLRSIAGVEERSRRVFGADLTFPALAVIAAFALGMVLMSKIGSSVNHILELNVAASLTCAAVLGSVWDTPKAPRVCAAGALMLVPMIAYSGTMLLNDRSPLLTVLLLKSPGINLHQVTPEEERAKTAIEAVVADLPRPVFIQDELLAQPWHATADRYPAVVVDSVFHYRAKALGLLGRGIEGLFADHYFGSAVLNDSSPFLVEAIRDGYRLTRTIRPAGAQPLHVLVRTP